MNCVRVCADVDLINTSIHKIDDNITNFDALANLYNAIGNATRLKIIYVIMNNKVCVCDLSDILKMSVSAVSQQLLKLKKVNLVESTKVKQTIYYSISERKVKFLQQILKEING